MKTQILNIEKEAKAITVSAKADIMLKVAIFTAILVCINVVAFI